MAYTNSPLATYKRISPNKTSPRNHIIDTITIHCYVGQVTAKGGCNAKHFVKYNPIAGASCNYVVGYDGSIGLCVEEKDRSWCSSNKANDHRAITIEVACEPVHPYRVTNEALNTLIELVADVCKRNDIKKLVWSTNKANRVNHLNGCNMTVHKDYARKTCPGQYLYDKHGYIADEVNKRLGLSVPTTTPATTTKDLYRIRKSWSDSSSQIGAYSSLENAKAACKEGYSVFDSNGNIIYSPTTKIVTKPSSSNISTYTYNQFVKDVQRAIGAEVDGIAGKETYRKCPTVSMRKNNRHPVVKPLQKYLNALGYNCGTADGIAGAKFDTAAKAWAKANGCIVDGEFTKKGRSWKKILRLI